MGDVWNQLNSNVVSMVVEGGVATVTLKDSAHRNVLSSHMVQGLIDAFTAAESNPEVRCVVITADGPAFCAGAELAVLEAAAEGDQSGIENVYRGFLRVAQSILPTIAVVDGPAVGAGLNLALAANVRLASVGARFDSRFAALRLIPGGGHVWMLSQLVGPQVTALMTLFGQPLGADDAAKCGLVWRTYPDQVASRAAADDLARRLSELETPYVSAMNSLLRSTSETITHAHAVDQERYLQRWSTTRPAFLEGVTAMRSSVDRRRESTV